MSLLRKLAQTRWNRTLLTRKYTIFNGNWQKVPHAEVIQECPVATCGYRETPSGLSIEREQSLNGSIPAYSKHIIICTGVRDWPSRIEDDPQHQFARLLKNKLRSNDIIGHYRHNVMVTNSSFTRSPGLTADVVQQSEAGRPPDMSDVGYTSAYIMPNHQFVPDILIEDAATEQFIKTHILATSHCVACNEVDIARAVERVQHYADRGSSTKVLDVRDVLVLICGHGQRDVRCGVLGPLLKAEFEEKLSKVGFSLAASSPDASTYHDGLNAPTVRVGLVSHIGGHKWAGNIIIYFPRSPSTHPLSGKGIWYGRVEPRHVEGVVVKTIVEGVIISNLFRGVVDNGATP